MNESNRQSLPSSYPSGPPPPLNHSYGGSNTVDSWMTTLPSAGQQLPGYATLSNHNDFDSIRQGYPSPGPVANGGANFMHHSYIQQPYINNKYGSAPDYSQTQFLYNSYSNNYVTKVDIGSKQSANNSDGSADTHMEEAGDAHNAEGLTARLLDKNSDGTPHSPSSQDSSSNGGVGYRPWEQPGADGQPLAQEQNNAQLMQNHPTRPLSAQSDKAQPPHTPQRTTPDTARRKGRSPSAQQFGDNHPIDRLSNQSNEKYQTLTPVPPIPPISAPYNHNMYAQPPPVAYPNQMSGVPYMQTPFAQNGGKALKMGVTEPDSSTPDPRISGIENSFQVPSVSSTTSRPVIGGIPQPSATPPHPITAQQVVSIHPPPQSVGEQARWEASQVPVPQNITQQTPAEGEKVTKKKRKRCGECPGCLKKDNCGDCGPCKSVRSHQICKMRKCDQLKTKKEKVREAAQIAAVAAASGMSLGKDITQLDGSSRNMNGTAIPTPFTNMGPNDTHTTGVGPTPRGSYSDFSSPKQHSANINQVYDSSPQTFTNFHMNPQQISGPYNGHGLVSDPNRSHQSPEENSINSDNTHINRHQMMNNRLKSLIQSRQNQKEINNGQNHNSFGSGPAAPVQPPPQSFAGQTFIVVQQQSSANTSLSPHYPNATVPPNPESGQSFMNMNWSQSEPTQDVYHKNSNGISDKLVVSGGGGPRTPFNSVDLPNGIYHSFNNNSQFNNTNETQINGNNINNNSNTTNNNNNNINSKNNSSNTNSNTSFTSTTSYQTNQNQSFSSANQEFSSHETNASLSTGPPPGRQTQRPSSRSSPARALNNNSSANNVNKSIESEGMSAISSNGVNTSQSHLSNEQTLENEPFLVNTTTTMHHNHHLSDLTTSMNTSTGIISSYNLSPHSQSSAFYPSSLYMPSLGVLGPSSPTVIMSVSGTDLETTKKCLEEPQNSVGHLISGIDCGRIIDPLDTSSLNLMDVSSMTSFIKSEPHCDPTSSSPLLSGESHYTFTSLTGASLSNTSTTTVLPPVSTFLLPNFRDQNWWDRNLDRLKTNTKDSDDCECYATDEREYRSSSPSTLTTLSASLSN